MCQAPNLFVRRLAQTPLQLLASRLLLQSADDADERHEQRDDDRADDQREKNNHDRLEHRGEAGDRIVDFVIVNFGDLQKHLGQLAGLFADVDHADDHRRKDAARFQRLHDRFAFLDAVVHLRDGVAR